MKVLVNFSVVPMGVGASVSEHVTACIGVLEASSVEFTLHANGTNVEGEFDEVMAAVRRCIEKLESMGVPRVYTVMTMDARFDKAQSMEAKVRSVARSKEP